VVPHPSERHLRAHAEGVADHRVHDVSEYDAGRADVNDQNAVRTNRVRISGGIRSMTCSRQMWRLAVTTYNIHPGVIAPLC
jgi:hypothetical protein